MLGQRWGVLGQCWSGAREEMPEARCPGRKLSPGPRIWSLLDALLDLTRLGFGSRSAVASYLGSAQWLDLLRSLQLSVFYHIYWFCSGALARD